MNPDVTPYFEIGCGRCPLVGTPDCKINPWRKGLLHLRSVILDTGVTEERKWSVPCYTVDNRNILMMVAFKDYFGISFFKGVLLKDPNGILVQQTKNVQAGRLIRFTDVQQVIDQAAIIKAYIAEAIEIEKAGIEVPMKTTADFEVPEELLTAWDADPAFLSAFEALTPGRQRGYLLYFAGAKQSTTRASRIEKMMPQIFEGRGLHDR